MRPRLILFALVGLIVVASRDVSAQARVLVQTARRDTIAANPGETVTSAFDVRNGTRQTVRAEPRIIVPNGWSVVIGAMPFNIAAESHDTWLVGVAPAATAPAGTYVIHAGVAVGGTAAVSDSVLVHVGERRGLELYPSEAPPFVMTGDRYPVSFFVRNRGNVAATLSLRATTSLGPPLALDQRVVTVQPGATVTIAGQVGSDAADARTRENVVELTAVDLADSTISASTSLRTTIVPRSRGWLDQLSTVPAELTVRSVGPNTGVSPASLAGSGRAFPGSNTQLDFLFRAPVSGPSLFGERDEYRVSLTADNYRVRLGDNLYGFSQLSSSWTSGFGAEVRGDVAGATAGAYVKKNRWSTIPGSERGLLVGTSTNAPASLSIIGVDRSGVSGAGTRMGVVAGKTHLGAGSLLEVEGAMSDSAGASGEAHRARLSGDVSMLSYDLSMLRGAPSFAGRDQGQTTAHAGITARVRDWAAFTGNMSALAYTPVTNTAGDNRLKSASIEGSFLLDRLAVAYDQTTRTDGLSLGSIVGSQRGVRFRANIPIGPLNLFPNLAEGVAHDIGPRDHRYESFGMTLHAPLQGVGSLDFFGQRTTGMVFEASGWSGGTTALLRLPSSNTVSLTAYGTIPIGDVAMYFALVDAEVSHRLANGLTLVLRDRMTSAGWRTASPRSNLIFVELRAPLRVPIGLARPTGLASGRILDEETGRGVRGALVRLGSEAAVSDASGRVTFASLAPGRYTASVDGAQGPRVTGALLTGDVAVDVPAKSRSPATFSLSLARGGQLRVAVRQLDFTTTLASVTSDSLADAGGFANAMIALFGARDTMYQTTNQDGVADFRDVPAGRWSVKLLASALPEAHMVDNDERGVTIRAGERATIGFQIVPKRRAVEFVEPPPVIARPGLARTPIKN
jgi:hypothetical protein